MALHSGITGICIYWVPGIGPSMGKWACICIRKRGKSPSFHLYLLAWIWRIPPKKGLLEPKSTPSGPLQNPPFQGYRAMYGVSRHPHYLLTGRTRGYSVLTVCVYVYVYLPLMYAARPLTAYWCMYPPTVLPPWRW